MSEIDLRHTKFQKFNLTFPFIAKVPIPIKPNLSTQLTWTLLFAETAINITHVPASISIRCQKWSLNMYVKKCSEEQ